MTELRVAPYVIPAADLGPENPLPIFRDPNHDRVCKPEELTLSAEDQAGLGWENGSRVLPYRLQDGYSRKRAPREFTSLVLENENLKVTVLPEVGGLVTSLIHKPLDRELIGCNTMFQPGNLALRNAWVSGGIEWNTPHLGHHYLTCEPFHAARVTGTQGEPVLRLYAWDRLHGFPFQIDLHLPPQSRFLFVRVRLINPHDHEIPMYWWTNMAVPEYPGGRVLCPTGQTFYGNAIHELPCMKGVDYTYATRPDHSYDLFFRIPEGQRPWETNLDAAGTGIVHTSTARLRGRKLFAWGIGPGGRRWNEYLHSEGLRCLEIQAGLAYTQGHTLAMPAGEQWTWTEALGYIETDPALTHGDSWQAAWQGAEKILTELLPAQVVDDFDAAAAQVTVRPPEEILFKGLSWAALEQRRAAQAGQEAGVPPELPFDASDLGPDQAPWLALLETGILPETDPSQEPGHYMIAPAWRALLEASLESEAGRHWLSWLHLGVMQLESEEPEAAHESWQRSLACTPNPWALRNLAALELREKHDEAACEYLKLAVQTGAPVAAIADEYASLLLKLGRHEAVCDFLDSLPAAVRANERLRLAAAWVALRRGRLDEVEAALQDEFATIREGEISLTDLWFGMHEQRLALALGREVDDEIRGQVRRDFPPPHAIDFRMYTAEDDKYIPPQASE